jgi:hypothetical protein
MILACSAEKSAQPPESDPAPQKAQPEPIKAEQEIEDLGPDVMFFDTSAAAIEELLKSKPQIIGFGEYHKLQSSAPVHSALRRFADEIFDVLGPHSRDLVLETWSVDPKCGKQGSAAKAAVEKTIERPPETQNEMQTLVKKTETYGMRGHVLHFSCEDYKALLKKQELDSSLLLELVTQKLAEAAITAFSTKTSNKTNKDKLVLIYGGATHNDRSPYAGLEVWSYVAELEKKTNANFMEVDLYVPEFVKDDPLLKQEAWYPLLTRARNDRVILVRRDSTSYILIMRQALGAESKTPP